MDKWNYKTESKNKKHKIFREDLPNFADAVN